MGTVMVILQVLGVVLLFLAAFGVGVGNDARGAPRVSLGWLGLAILALVWLFGSLGG
jgi:hypothetical protein